MRFIALIVFFLLASACSREDLLQRFSSPEDQATAKGYIENLRARNFEEIEKAADQSIHNPDLHSTLVKMADLIPSGEPSSVKLVGAQSFRTPEATTVNTTFEYAFGDKWLLTNVAVKNKDGVKTIVSFHVNPETQSLERQNTFSLVGKPFAAYVILASAIVGFLVSLCALFACIKTRLPGRKWPWVLFILLGVGKVSVNWATGQWAIAPLYVQLFSASALAALNGPWVISASLPLGAIWFLLQRRRRPEVAHIES